MAITRTTLVRKHYPPLEVTPAQELALLARMLHREGFDDHLAGHITSRQPDGTFLVNPWGLRWNELRASDVARMDAQGNQVGGDWIITPAITLHVVLHRHRPDAGVVVHNHPRWSTVWADARRVPPIYDQTGAMYTGEIVLYDEYGGPVADESSSERAVAAIGAADVALLAHHGVLVIGRDVHQAYIRSTVVEWRCRQAWHVEALGAATPMDETAVRTFAGRVDAVDDAFPGYFEAMARFEIREDPSVLQ